MIRSKSLERKKEAEKAKKESVYADNRKFPLLFLIRSVFTQPSQTTREKALYKNVVYILNFK